MRRHAEDSGVFIRSVASRGHLGGLSESIHRIVDVMDAAGRDFVIIETVGTGQSEVEVAEIADLCVVVNAPNMGDDVQAMKAGVLEIADVLVVNKADLPLARRTTEQLKNMLKLRRERLDVPVIETVATKETGIEVASRDDRRPLTTATGDKQKTRERRMRRLIAQSAGRIVHGRIRDAAGGELEDLVKTAASGEIGITEAARAGAEDCSLKAVRVAASHARAFLRYRSRRGAAGGAAGKNTAAEERALKRGVAVNAAAAEAGRLRRRRKAPAPAGRRRR